MIKAEHRSSMTRPGYAIGEGIRSNEKKKGVGIETKHEEESMKTGEKGNKKSGLEE
jgi:hypothetical protein